VTRSRDGGDSFEAEIAAIPKKTGVCACCGLNIATADDGRVLIVFRSATAMVNRDIHVLISKDFGKTFKIETVDPWTVGKCVMSTAAFAQDGRNVLAAWETKEQVRFAIFNDKGLMTEPFTMPDQATVQKHPSVAINGRGESVVAWTEGTGWNKGGSLVWQKFDSKCRPISSETGRVEGLRPWSVPAVVAVDDGSFRIAF
jgi:hypothetical protein